MCVNREMENMNDEPIYNVKITGNGTFAGIMNTLRSIADEMDLILESGKTPPDNIEWEDPILMTEIQQWNIL